MGGCVRHLIEGREADVVERVTRPVVARVILDTGRPTARFNLLGGLDPLGAGEKPTGRNTNCNEGPWSDLASVTFSKAEARTSKNRYWKGWTAAEYPAASRASTT